MLRNNGEELEASENYVCGLTEQARESGMVFRQVLGFLI